MVRTEKEMYDMLLQIAREDERIKAVYMNGSRTNKNVPKDIFQDYDIVYVVTDTKPFIDDKGWINRSAKYGLCNILMNIRIIQVIKKTFMVGLCNLGMVIGLICMWNP